MATPRLGLVVEDKPTELSCMYSECSFVTFTDSSLTHSNLAAVLETVEVGKLEDCLYVPLSVQRKLQQQYDNDEELRNELISWWLLFSPYAFDSWRWLSGRLFCRKLEIALAAAKRYVHQTVGMSCGFCFVF